MKIFTTLITIVLISSSLVADTPQLSVRGEARLSVPADQIILVLGVVTENRMAKEALSKNNANMQAVLKALKGLGLKESDIQTSSFRIDPIWQTKPVSPTPDWTPTIIAFKVTNTIEVRSDQLSLAGKLIDTAIEAGANKVTTLTFGLKNPQSHRDEAIAKATAKAISDAQTIAKAANVTLGEVLNITLDNASLRPPIAFRAMQASVPIEAGDVEVTAMVNMEYEIQSH